MTSPSPSPKPKPKGKEEFGLWAVPKILVYRRSLKSGTLYFMSKNNFNFWILGLVPIDYESSHILLFHLFSCFATNIYLCTKHAKVGIADGCGTFNIYIWFSVSCSYKLAINHPSDDGEVKDGLINGTFNLMGEILSSR